MTKPIKTGKWSALGNKSLGVFGHVLNSVDSVANTVNKVVPGIVNETTKMVDAHIDKHRDDFKMPNLVGLPLLEAERVLQVYQLQYSVIRVVPAATLASVQPNVVLAMTPKADRKVSPTTFVRISYADDAVIATSQNLRAAQQQAKADKQAARRQQVAKLGGAVSGQATKLAGKLPRRKKHPEQAD
ncbi:PASTA domain-containing protein [Lacticaseibacillus sp. GG6-2]